MNVKTEMDKVAAAINSGSECECSDGATRRGYNLRSYYNGLSLAAQASGFSNGSALSQVLREAIENGGEYKNPATVAMMPIDERAMR